MGLSLFSLHKQQPSLVRPPFSCFFFCSPYLSARPSPATPPPHFTRYLLEFSVGCFNWLVLRWKSAVLTLMHGCSDQRLPGKKDLFVGGFLCFLCETPASECWRTRVHGCRVQYFVLIEFKCWGFPPRAQELHQWKFRGFSCLLLLSDDAITSVHVEECVCGDVLSPTPQPFEFTCRLSGELFLLRISLTPHHTEPLEPRHKWSQC